MKILIDHNVHQGVFYILQEFGYSAETAKYNHLEMLSNGKLSAEAFKLGFRCILTQDKTFSLDAKRVLETLPQISIILILPEYLPQKPRESYLQRFRDLITDIPHPKNSKII